MTEIFSIYNVVVVVLLAIIGVLAFAVRNLLLRNENYEDIVKDQSQYLQNISNAVGEGQKHLKDLDEKGTFQSDDEVGYFFEQMMNVQKELNRYMLPENYGKKEE
jgi:hypothetical protein